MDNWVLGIEKGYTVPIIDGTLRVYRINCQLIYLDITNVDVISFNHRE
jgi:hypothetical protein